MTTQTQSFHVGQTVYVAADYLTAFPAFVGVKLVVEKVPVGARGINYTVRPEAGGRGIKGGAYLFTTEAPLVNQPLAMTPYVAPLLPGTVVRFKRPTAKTSGVFVVTAEAGKGLRVSSLGGSSRYFTSVPQNTLEVIPLDRITIAD